MEFCDLNIQRERIRESLNRRMERVLQHTKFILGPEVEELELQLADFCNVRHAITVANGTDALQIALRALGVGPGDEVVTTAFSFFATAEACLLVGATPVFADIDTQTFNLDPESLMSVITNKTKAIIPVSLYGQVAALDEINQIAEQKGLAVIEDAAQSFGAKYKGRRSCSMTTIACTSFFPSKPLGCYGDGGALLTSDKKLADNIKRIRSHGQEQRYRHVQMGTNSRLDSLQAAILLSKMEVFEDEIQKRQVVASRYTKLLNAYVKTPIVLDHNLSAWAQFTIRHPERDRLQGHLQKLGIPTAIHYPIPLHQQPLFAGSNTGVHLKESERAAKEVLSLPMHPYLSEADQTLVVDAVRSFGNQM